MSEDTTTIEITTQQRAYLRDVNRSSAKDALQETIESHKAGSNEGVDTERIVEELKSELSMANDPVVDVDLERLYGRLDELEAQLPDKVGENVEGRLR